MTRSQGTCGTDIRVVTCRKWAHGLGRPRNPTKAHGCTPLGAEVSSDAASTDPEQQGERNQCRV